MSRPPKREMTISLFSFLDALICTMGALILLLLSMAVKLQEQTRARQAAALKRAAEVQQIEVDQSPRVLPPAVTVVDNTAELEAERERRRLAWNELVAQSEEERNRRAQAAQAQQEAMLTAEQKVRAAELSLAEIMRQIAAAEAEVGKLETAENELRTKQINAEQQLGLSRRRLDDLKKRQSNAPSRFALVPFDGTSGTVRQPIYIECTDRGLQFLPEGQLITADDLEGFSEGFNPLLAGAESLFDYWTAKHVKDPEHVPEPYVLLLVRPSGTVSYYAARLLLNDLKTPFGYELIEENFPLSVPTADPAAKSIVQRAVRITLEARGELAAKGDRRSMLGLMPNDTNQFGQPGAGGSGGGGSGGGFEGQPDPSHVPMSSNARSPADGLNVRQGRPRRPAAATGRGNVAGGFGTGEPGGSPGAGGRVLGSPGSKLPAGKVPGSEPGLADLRNRGTGLSGTGTGNQPGTGKNPGSGGGTEGDFNQGGGTGTGDLAQGGGDGRQPDVFHPERGQITGSKGGNGGSSPKPKYASLGMGRGTGEGEGQSGDGSDGAGGGGTDGPVDGPPGAGGGEFAAGGGEPGVDAQNASLTGVPELQGGMSEEEPIGAKPRRLTSARGNPGVPGGRGAPGGTAAKGSPPGGKGASGRSGGASTSSGPSSSGSSANGQKLQSLPEESEEWRTANPPGSEPADVLPEGGLGSSAAAASAAKQDETFRKIAGINRSEGEAGPGTGGTRRSIMDGPSGSRGRGQAGDRSELRWGSQSGKTIGLEQDVRVDLYADKIVFGPKMPAMPVAQGETRAQLVEKVSARIEHVVAGWGDAPARFHWIPRVKFIVHPGGNQHYERLNQPLKEWGLSSTMEYSLDSQPEPAAAPPQKSSQSTTKKGRPIKARK